MNTKINDISNTLTAKSVSVNTDFARNSEVSTTKKNYLILHKGYGKFYTAYNMDAHIMNYIFGYKVLENKKAGFPDNAIEKVINKLNELKVSYQIIYVDRDPVVKKFLKYNKYSEYYENAKLRIGKNEKLDLLSDKIKNASLEDLERIEEALDAILG